MAHLEDEWEHDRETRASAAREDSGLPDAANVPDILADRAALKLVPWAGEGPDPLDEVG